MINNVFNNSLGSKYVFEYPNLSAEEEQVLLAELFEQFLIFDRITITASRRNFALYFLIKHLGINIVESLIERKYIVFILWSPIIVTGTGKQLEDGTMDESSILGMPPIVSGSLSDEDMDPEKNINDALNSFGFHRDRKRSFTRTAVKNYQLLDGMLLSANAADLVISAYKSNNLASLGLPFLKEPDQLGLTERSELLELSHKVIETGILAKYGLKSYENYERYEICKQNIENIGLAFNIANNNANLFKLENVPDLKQIFLSEKLTIGDALRMRNMPNAKYYRKWINSVGESSNAKEVSAEYMNQIRGDGKFFQTKGGKFLKNLALFGLTTSIGAAVAGPIGTAVGGGLGLLDTLWLDSILRGRNPSMFIKDVEIEIAPDAVMPPID